MGDEITYMEEEPKDHIFIVLRPSIRRCFFFLPWLSWFRRCSENAVVS